MRVFKIKGTLKDLSKRSSAYVLPFFIFMETWNGREHAVFCNPTFFPSNFGFENWMGKESSYLIESWVRIKVTIHILE